MSTNITLLSNNCSKCGTCQNHQHNRKGLKRTICLVGNYMLKVNKTITGARCEICSKLTVKTPEGRNWRHSGVFIVNLEHISHLVLVFLLLTLSR